jgi:hypothetical protein
LRIYLPDGQYCPSVLSYFSIGTFEAKVEILEYNIELLGPFWRDCHKFTTNNAVIMIQVDFCRLPAEIVIDVYLQWKSLLLDNYLIHPTIDNCRGIASIITL